MHTQLPDEYAKAVKEAAIVEHRSASEWVAVHIMNAIDAGTPAVRVRKEGNAVPACTHPTDAEKTGSRRQAVADSLREAEPYLPLHGRREDTPSMWLFLADVAIEAYESAGK